MSKVHSRRKRFWEATPYFNIYPEKQSSVQTPMWSATKYFLVRKWFFTDPPQKFRGLHGFFKFAFQAQYFTGTEKKFLKRKFWTFPHITTPSYGSFYPAQFYANCHFPYNFGFKSDFCKKIEDASARCFRSKIQFMGKFNFVQKNEKTEKWCKETKRIASLKPGFWRILSTAESGSN